MNLNKGYIYTHTRLDTNIVFYVGEGGFNKKEIVGTYTRAYHKYNRSKEWKEIINTTNYRVDIILQDLSLSETFLKEKEYILFYGRIDLNTGTLVNKTSGGQGVINRIITDETRKKQSKAKDGYIPWNKGIKTGIEPVNKGIPNSEEIRKLISQKTKGLKKKPRTKEHIYNNVKHKLKPINQYDLQHNFIKEWLSIKEASIHLKINPSNIGLCCNNKRNKAGNFIWKFKL